MNSDIHIKNNGEYITILVTLDSKKYRFNVSVGSMLAILGLDEDKCGTGWKPIKPDNQEESK